MNFFRKVYHISFVTHFESWRKMKNSWFWQTLKKVALFTFGTVVTKWPFHMVGRDSIFKKNEKVRVSCNIKCLRRRTVLIQSALCSPDLGECFTYPEHVPNSYKKFSRGLWKKVSAQNMTICQNILTPFWASFFENINFFHFSLHIIW